MERIMILAPLLLAIAAAIIAAAAALLLGAGAAVAALAYIASGIAVLALFCRAGPNDVPVRLPRHATPARRHG
jgi:hypothetical protein